MNSIKKIQQCVICLLLLNLVGCGSLIHAYGEMADAQDPCQMKSKPETHVRPEWCKAGRGYVSPVRVYTPQGQHIATVR